jgi:hypothetical protein
VLTVLEFARRHGFDSGGTEHNIRRRVVRRIRALERATGYKILVGAGDGLVGRGKALLIREDLYAAAWRSQGEAERVSRIDEVADEIATRVREMDERHTEMSVKIAELNIRVEKLERRVWSGTRST